MFTDIVQENQFDIIGVTETWLTDDYPSEYIQINNYKFLRSNRPTRGGGLGVYLKNKFDSKIYYKNNQFDTGLEQLWLKIKINKHKVGLCVVYKQPGVNVNCFDEFCNVLEGIYNEVDSIIILGDININLLKKNNESNYFQNILTNFNLNQIVKDPTRISKEGESLIDVVCVSNHLKINLCENIEMYDVTDHMMVSCVVSINECFTDENGKKFFRNYSNFNYNLFSNEAFTLNWRQILDVNDINQKVMLLNDNINYLFDKHAPLVEYNPNKKRTPPYITYTIKKMIQLRQKAYKKYLRTRASADKRYYLDLKNYVGQAIKQEKNSYMKYQLQANQNNPRGLWNKLREWGVKNKKNINSCNLPKEISPNDINKYFVNIAGHSVVDINLLNFYNNNFLENIPEFKFTLATCTDIYRTINSIKTNAQGIDNINIKMIKIVLPFIVDYLVHIINTSLTTGKFPVVWKTAVVTPCPKIENSLTLNDLRPLNILPTLSKCIEKIVADQLKTFLCQNSILPSVQSGFRNKYSTQTALLKVTDDITEALDNSMVTFIVLLDQSKAFDIVHHELLMAKLKYIGLSEEVLVWFNDYVNGRTQCVKYKNDYSGYQQTISGVPQGSILGPILFSIFIFDIGNVLKHISYHLYADDIQLYISSPVHKLKDSVELINNDLNNFSTWCKQNGLKINPNKSVALCIGSDINLQKINFNTLPIMINNEEIKRAHQSKNLGVILDEKLNFEPHINKIVGTAYMKLKMLNRLKNSLNEQTKFMLVQSLIYPSFDYCLPVYYGFLTQYNKFKLQKIQNACMRFAYGIPYRQHITPYYIIKKEMKLDKRFIYIYGVLLYKLVRSKCPQYLFVKLARKSDIHDVNLRFNNYRIPRHNTTKFKGSFSYNATIILNKITQFLGLSENAFKSTLKQLLLLE